MTCSSSKVLQLCLKHETQLWPGESSPPQPHSCCLLAAHTHSDTRRSLRKVSSSFCILCGGSRAGDTGFLCMADGNLCPAVLLRAKPSLSSTHTFEQHTHIPPAAEWSQTALSSFCPVGNVCWLGCWTWEEDAGAKHHCRSCSPAGGKIKGLRSLSPLAWSQGILSCSGLTGGLWEGSHSCCCCCSAPVRLAQGRGDAVGWNHSSWTAALGKVPAHGRRWNQVAFKVLSNPNHLKILWFSQCLVGNSPPPKLTNLPMTKCTALGRLMEASKGTGLDVRLVAPSIRKVREIQRGETWALSCKESCAAVCISSKGSLALGLAAEGRGRKGHFPSSQNCLSKPSSLDGNGRTPWKNLITCAHFLCGSAASCSATSKFHFIASHVLSLSLCAPQVATAF